MFHIQSVYRDNGINAYGNKCEWIGCGWDAASCDAHHINYQEQQAIENKIRKAFSKNSEEFNRLLQEAKEMGFPYFNKKTRQLDKDDRTSNITMLCPNHHRYVHTMDLGMKVLAYIPPRKS